MPRPSVLFVASWPLVHGPRKFAAADDGPNGGTLLALWPDRPPRLCPATSFILHVTDLRDCARLALVSAVPKRGTMTLGKPGIVRGRRHRLGIVGHSKAALSLQTRWLTDATLIANDIYFYQYTLVERMLDIASPITDAPLVLPCHRGHPWPRASFRRQRPVMHMHLRCDDLITFGGEKNVSLVSAILSVKYSGSALLCCPQVGAASGQGQRRSLALRGTVRDTWERRRC